MLNSPALDKDEKALQDTVDLLDPQRYLRAADWAFAMGRREDAIALITQAYLAFDLLRTR